MSLAPDEIPKKVGRYVVEESIGFGAMGAVYKARDPLISRMVAIKTIRLDVPPNSPHYRSFLQRFYTEAQVSGTLSHPNIVTLFDIGETEDGIPFLAMEYVDGETVAELLESGERLGPEMVVALVSQMAAAIDYAHTKGVVHRDIKPSNIIVYEGEKIKITDFGIAKLMDAEGTQTASLLGTPSYMSPEQAMGENLDGRTDIFSLGVVAFEMLSGEQPFPGNNVTSILYKLVHVDPIRPDNLEVLGLLPDKWHLIFSRVLAKDPADRYATAASFVEDLEQCLGSWFGALEGETVVISAPEISKVRQDMSEQDSGSSASSDSSEIPPSDPTRPAEPRLPDDEIETLLLSSEPTQDGETPSEPSEKDETSKAGPTARPALAQSTAGVTGVVAKAVDLGQEADRETETVALSATPSEKRAARVSEQTAKRSMATAGPRWTRKHLAVVAFLLALATVAAVAVWITTVRQPELVYPVPPDPVPIEPVPLAGMLSVVSEPEGATVWVDDQQQGETPLERPDMAFGAYLVRLEKEGFKPQELVAALSADKPNARLDVALEPALAPRPRPSRAYVTVESTPAEAEVLLDGAPVGITPIERLRAQPGPRNLLVRKEGFEPWETTLDLKAGTTEAVSATLRAIEIEPPPDEPVAPEVQIGELVERGPRVVDPKCIDCPNVPYPDEAKRAKLQGVVEVNFLVDENGIVQDIEIEESGGEIFDRAVTVVLRTWRYQPATKDGVAVKVRLNRRFRFRRGR